MRRKVTLYVGGRKADLADTSFLLMNYTAEDLSNPTIVKNSFSQQVTLPGTCRNNSIFGAMWRSDRRALAGGSTGAQFDASKRTPFILYGADGAVLESGYLKLDEVVRKGPFCREYKVNLYGGLGDFFYGLSYNPDGSKKTLADLDYLGSADPATELDFDINAATVQEAWDAMDNDTPGKWQVINFMPAYEGTPENFSANKGLATPALTGLDGSRTEGGTQYGPDPSGYTLVTLPKNYDQWAVKDLRSYLQRPVLSMKAFFDAIVRQSEKNGYVFDPAAINDTQFVYRNAWKTLPTLPALYSGKEITAGLTLTYESYSTGYGVAKYNINGTIPSGTKVTAYMSLRLVTSLSAITDQYAVEHADEMASYGWAKRDCVSFVQLVAYDSNGYAVGGSKVSVIADMSADQRALGRNFTVEELASECGFTPTYPLDDMWGERLDDTWTKFLGAFRTVPIALATEGYDVAYYIVEVHPYIVTSKAYRGGSLEIDSTSAVASARPRFYKSYSEPVDALAVTVSVESGSVSKTEKQNLRSGAHFTKAMLLTTEKTPADYLISFAKIFGLYFVTDPAEKKVTLLRRNALYEDETIDLTSRVDKEEIAVSQFAFAARWYDFSLPSAGGAYADEYKALYGREYGIQRVNTGYDFDVAAVSLLSGNAYRSGVTVLESNAYWNYITEGGVFRPSPFIDFGGKYALWSAAGGSHDFDITPPSTSASITYYGDHPGEDVALARKMQFHAADGKSVDGADILVSREGWNSYEHFKLTDDVTAMDALNDGTPCWLLDPGPEDGIRIPIFQRYGDYRAGGYTVDWGYDFGIPAENMLNAMYTSNRACTIYLRCWKKYMEDRYSKDTKVMTCKVELSGLQVGQDLLRKFYFYDGSLWALNKITNHSLTTYGPTECEFVQVHDKNNYLNGQE